MIQMPPVENPWPNQVPSIIAAEVLVGYEKVLTVAAFCLSCGGNSDVHALPLTYRTPHGRPRLHTGKAVGLFHAKARVFKSFDFEQCRERRSQISQLPSSSTKDYDYTP